MTEYIERQKLVGYFQERFEWLRKASEQPMGGGKVRIDTEIQAGTIIAKEFLDKAKAAPAADVVEVRHGELLQTEEPLGWRDVGCIECSSCHESWIMCDDLEIDDYKNGWKYCPNCPNCGAKMDGKGGVGQWKRLKPQRYISFALSFSHFTGFCL